MRATVVTAGHCTHGELRAMLWLAVTAVACTPAVPKGVDELGLRGFFPGKILKLFYANHCIFWQFPLRKVMFSKF